MSAKKACAVGAVIVANGQQLFPGEHEAAVTATPAVYRIPMLADGFKGRPK